MNRRQFAEAIGTATLLAAVSGAACAQAPNPRNTEGPPPTRARYVARVCTGSLALAAAGLLRGYRATSHWYVRHVLPIMGAIETKARVVEDRGRITAGGVTAGIDLALHLAARLRGDDYARRIQLVIEYDPAPPFRRAEEDQGRCGGRP
jgi:hypothetical protein